MKSKLSKKTWNEWRWGWFMVAPYHYRSDCFKYNPDYSDVLSEFLQKWGIWEWQ